MEKIKIMIEWLGTKPNWAKIVILAAAAAIAFAMTACNVTHKVTQSSYNTSTGDSIVIRYEQYGRLKK